MLPDIWQNFTLINPIYWMINGIRLATLGIADTTHLYSMGVSLVFALIFSILASYLFSKGYRIKT
jgi:ABC-2 type transport system permease protein